MRIVEDRGQPGDKEKLVNALLVGVVRSSLSVEAPPSPVAISFLCSRNQFYSPSSIHLFF